MATQLSPPNEFATRTPSISGLGNVISKFKNWFSNLFSRNDDPKCFDSYIKQAEKMKIKIAQEQMKANIVGFNSFTRF